MRVVCQAPLFLVALLLLSAPSLANAGEHLQGGHLKRDTSNNNASKRVAVVGGGASGILSARELQRLGYTVTIFEASDRIGGLSTTIDVKGMSYDLSTIFMSSGDFKNSGLTAEMDILLHEAGLRENIIPWAGATKQLISPTRMVDFLPLSIIGALQKGNGQDVLNEIFAGLAIIEGLVTQDAQGVAAASSGEVDVDTSETFNEWADRVGAGCLRDFLEPLTDSLMGGPSGVASATYVLNQRARLGPQAVVNLVLFVIKTMSDILQAPDISKAPLSIQKLIARGPVPSWMSFDSAHGFQIFWESLVESHGLDIQLESPVEHILLRDDVKKDGIGISVGGKVETYDGVVLALPPYATASILNSSKGLPADIASLVYDFAEVPQEHSVISVALEAESEVVFPDGIGAIILTTTSEQNTPIALAKQREKGDVQITGIYASGRCDDLDLNYYGKIAKENLEEKLSEFDYRVENIVDIACFDAWPYRPSIDQMKDGFIDRIEAAQGQGNIVFAGEILTGAGIPSLAQYATASIQNYFPSIMTKKKREKRNQYNQY